MCPFARIKKQFLPFEQLCICIGRRVWICVNIACAQSLLLRRCLGSYRPTEQYHWCVILVGRWKDREVAEVDQFRPKSWTQTFKFSLPTKSCIWIPQSWGLSVEDWQILLRGGIFENNLAQSCFCFQLLFAKRHRAFGMILSYFVNQFKSNLHFSLWYSVLHLSNLRDAKSMWIKYRLKSWRRAINS